MSETKEGHGTIEEMSRKDGRVTFKISGKYYSYWARKTATAEEKNEFLAKQLHDFAPNDNVEFTYVENENPNGGAPYKNIRSMKKGSPKADNKTDGAQQQSTDVSAYARRKDALLIAAEFLKACPSVVDERAPVETLLKTSHVIENHLCAALVLPQVNNDKPDEEVY